MAKSENSLFNAIYSKKVNFYWVNISFWVIFGTLWTILYSPEGCPVKEILRIFISNSFVPFLITSILRFLFKRYLKIKSNKPITFITAILVSAYLSSVIMYYLDIIFTTIYNNYSFGTLFKSTPFLVARRTTSIFILLSFWCSLYFIVNLFYQWKTEKEDKERALYLALNSKMEVLKNQINPHFLFNSLNSISELIDENPEKAKIIIDELASFLRYSLTYKENSRIELKKEISFIKHYLHIQSIRFEQNLEVNIKIDKRTEFFMIPPAILYPLVENAIKHGMETSKLPLKIDITSGFEKDKITISIKNTGNWRDIVLDDNHSTKTGLTNVKERLKCEYNDRFHFNVTSENEIVEVKLTFFI